MLACVRLWFFLPRPAPCFCLHSACYCCRARGRGGLHVSAVLADGSVGIVSGGSRVDLVGARTVFRLRLVWLTWIVVWVLLVAARGWGLLWMRIAWTALMGARLSGF